MTSSKGMLETAQEVVARLPVPFSKDDFMQEYRRYSGEAFPPLKSLNINARSFNEYFRRLPNVHEALVDGEFFYLSPNSAKGKNDVRREMREQLFDRCLLVAKSFEGKPFRAINFAQVLRRESKGATLPLKSLGYSNVSELLKKALPGCVRMLESRRGRGGGLYEYFREEDATAATRTSKTPQGSTMAARSIVDPSPTAETRQRRRSLVEPSPVRRSAAAPSVIAIKRELPEIEIVFESAPPAAKRPNLNLELNGQQTPAQATPLHYFPMQPAFHNANAPSEKNRHFAYFIACKLDEAERDGRDVGQLHSYIHGAFTTE